FQCIINNNSIRGLKLFALDVYGNENICDLSWMTSLRILNIGDNTKINSQGIKGLSLFSLVMENNRNIKDISGLTSLKILQIGKGCNLDHSFIKLKLFRLSIIENTE